MERGIMGKAGLPVIFNRSTTFRIGLKVRLDWSETGTRVSEEKARSDAGISQKRGR
jgi:hypothetical protein